MSQQQNYRGLSDPDVERSRNLNGANVLSAPCKAPLWKVFLVKFTDPLIIILLIAGVLSVCISLYEHYSLGKSAGEVFFEPLGIFAAIILATGLSFIFEQKADREFSLLNKVSDDDPVQVIRSGNATSIPKKDIVVGDIVILNTGDEVPADGTLLESTSMSIDESSLTGEPICHKTTDNTKFDPDATFPSNQALRGTKVMEGHGIMEVSAVGDATENGKVNSAIHIDDSVTTPLNIQLRGLGHLISKIAYGVAAAVIIGRVVMYFSSTSFEWVSFISYMLQSLMLAVSLVVMSVPEGLPMAVTLSLAYSMRRMLKTNNLVRKMHACETMGAATVICTDKTGTLTQNRMQVYKADFFGNPTENTIYEGIAVNSTAHLDLSKGIPEILGNPTEGAMLLWLREKGADAEVLRAGVRIVEELPFSTERKFMASVAENSDHTRTLYVKGAPEIVFGMCSETPGITKKEIDALLLDYQNQAMRTLGFTYKILAPGETAITDNRLTAEGLTFLGVAAISDPVRADVPDAVREVTEAGIQVKIVTGDTPNTAKEIARQIGLWDDSVDDQTNIITGNEFELLSDDEIRQRAGDLKIIARARPLDKKRLVEALQANGEVVAVTGDGTNDAPALKAAHVGLSMGDGTSVAKEASDITIVDNSFSSIGRAVMWGRSLYRNIQRFILFQMTVNVAGCLIMLIGSFMGMQSPLSVTQMLWINLIMDTFAAVALASLPPTSSVMAEKPRSRNAFIISPAMWRSIIGTGGAFFIALICILYYFEHTSITGLRQIGNVAISSLNTGLTPYELSVFFCLFVMLQFWNMFNARAFATGRSALHLKGCSGFILISLIILIGQIVIVTFGGEFFSVRPLPATDWAIIIASTSVVLWTGELIRLIKTDKK